MFSYRSGARAGAALFVLGASACLIAPATAQEGPETPPPLPEDTEWKTTASGLKYAVIEPGEAEPVAGPGDRVEAHYTGWLKDGGTKNDSSRDRGSPFGFTVGQGVIRGWSEGVQLMPVGATYRFEIPADLAYGAEGRPPRIPQNATLLFDIELVSHEAAAKPHPFEPGEAGEPVEVTEGLTYQVVREGEGATCGEEDIFMMHLSLYSGSGDLLQSSLVDGQPLFGGTPQQMNFPVLKVMPTKMSPGSLFRVTADKAQGLGEKSPPGVDSTVWILEMMHVQQDLEQPEFSKPPEDELTTSDSGLQWKVLREGEGESPEETDLVVAHYCGKLTDGKVFDSSYERGIPTPFPLNRVIPGWTEGVGMMKPGGARILVIPASLGYGAQGQPPEIPGGATLVFYIELLSVEG